MRKVDTVLKLDDDYDAEFKLFTKTENKRIKQSKTFKFVPDRFMVDKRKYLDTTTYSDRIQVKSDILKNKTKTYTEAFEFFVDIEHSIIICKHDLKKVGDFDIKNYASLNKQIELKKIKDIDNIKKVLDTEFPWFFEVNAFVYDQLLMRSFSDKPTFKLTPILLDGPPGTGKTSWCNRLAELSDTVSVMVDSQRAVS